MTYTINTVLVKHHVHYSRGLRKTICCFCVKKTKKILDQFGIKRHIVLVLTTIKKKEKHKKDCFMGSHYNSIFEVVFKPCHKYLIQKLRLYLYTYTQGLITFRCYK